MSAPASDNVYQTLQDYGLKWLSGREISTNLDNDIIPNFNGILSGQGIKFKLGRGWQPRDPVIRGGIAIFDEFDQNPQQNAISFIKFLQNNTWFYLSKLPPTMQAFILIIFVCEIGRGYSSGIKDLIDRICAIANDANAQPGVWRSLINDFAFMQKGDSDPSWIE